MTVGELTSAGGVLSLLDEPQVPIQVHALRTLTKLVDVFWAEIASAISKIEALYERDGFPEAKMAALLLSKVYYHLEELDESLKYALGAQDAIDFSEKSEFIDTLTRKCIDDYCKQKTMASETGNQINIDPRLELIVNKMFERSIEDGQFKQALGIALECKRLDQVRESVIAAGGHANFLGYCVELCQTAVPSRAFRSEVLRVIVQLYHDLPNPDYTAICQCLLFLDDAAGIASILDSLLKSDGEKFLIAFQIGFELSENENQPLLLRVIQALPASNGSESKTHYDSILSNLKLILSGEMAIELNLDFLYSNSKTDLLIIKEMKEKSGDGRNSVLHHGAVVAHAFMHAGTTRDRFIRDNLDWLGKASNWAKFSVTAAFGVIHKGHHKKSMKLLGPYLPQNGSRSSPYLEGGALYGLGLIHVNRGGDLLNFFQESLRNSGNNEILQHGGCLGLGLNAMATYKEDVFEELKEIVYSDNAVAGEAAGMAIGLVFLGSGNSVVVDELLAYSRETQHEKIIRGLSLGIGLSLFTLEDQADGVISQLLTDKDPIMRYGGCYTIAMAYVGTGNNSAIRKLLHIAVSDVSHDVRRMAVMALGFVMCNTPEKVPQTVALLAESYDPNERYGAALAIGIACSGTGSKSAVKILQALQKDRVDFVRQGAFISLSMVLIQRNGKQEPAVDDLRAAMSSVIETKMGDTMTKLGAILGSGILDAGGRNVSIALLSAGGQKRMAAIVGLSLFIQYWYWYPLMHMINLAFLPTSVIGLNKDLKMPSGFRVRCNAKPSLFAYPPQKTIKKEEKAIPSFTAELSISAKSKARAAKRRKDRGDEEVDMEVEESVTEKKDDTEMSTTPLEAVVPKEQDFFDINNPGRVTLAQRSYLSVVKGLRYTPVTGKLSGFVLLKDNDPESPEELVSFEQPKVFGVGEEEEAPVPEPFQFTR